jgi:hypothetical protein
MGKEPPRASEEDDDLEVGLWDEREGYLAHAARVVANSRRATNHAGFGRPS